jgi:CheY-like chemotaxis protein
MKKILIAEDDRFMANVCRQKFEEAGFEVALANDGHDAIEHLVLHPPSVVLLDLMLPGLDGIGVLKFLRSRERLRSLPVVVISNSSYFAGVVQEAWQAGATHFVNKGDCSPKTLVEEVIKAMAPAKEPAVTRSEHFSTPAPPQPPVRERVIGEPPPRPPVRAQTGLPRTKVLVADDDHVIHGVLTFFLTQAGFSVRSAYDGRQALEMAIAQAPDLLVLDGMMPELHGHQVLERWSLHPTLSKIPVIMLTGMADEEKKSTALRDGAVAYLVKPFSPDELVKRVQHFI